MTEYPDGYVEAHLPDYPDESDRTYRRYWTRTRWADGIWSKWMLIIDETIPLSELRKFFAALEEGGRR